MRQIHNSGLDEYQVLSQAPGNTGEAYGWCCKPQSSDISNMKLSIRRKQDGTILAHCFHCGHSGAWVRDDRKLSTAEISRRLGELGRCNSELVQHDDERGSGHHSPGRSTPEGTTESDSEGERLPPMNWDASVNPDLAYYVRSIGPAWSNPAIPDSVYHIVYGRWRLRPDVVETMGIHAYIRARGEMDTSFHRDEDAWVSVGSRREPHQYRRVGRNEQGHSKWYTVSKPRQYLTYPPGIDPDDYISEWAMIPYNTYKTLIVVEDVPSAIYLSSLSQGPVLALQGTNLDTSRLPEIDDLLRVLVWLDNDSHEIVRKATKMATILSAHYNVTAKCCKAGDPKDFTPY